MHSFKMKRVEDDNRKGRGNLIMYIYIARKVDMKWRLGYKLKKKLGTYIDAICMHACVLSHSIVSYSETPRTIQPARLLCP